MAYEIFDIYVEDEWLKLLNRNVKSCKQNCPSFDTLVDRMQGRGYIIRFKDTFEKVYWEE